MSGRDKNVVVIGGGVIGVSIAYFLVKRGVNVTLVEKDEIGRGASFGNAGAIAPGHAPINKPGRVKQAFKSIFDPLSPLYVKPRPDPEMIKWFWQFRAFCGENRLLEALEILGKLGHPTSRLFEQIIEVEGLDCHYTPDGYYEIFKTDTAFSAAKHEAELTERYGYHPKAVSGDELREREPAIASDIIGGVFFSDAATIDPYRFVCGLAEATQRHGAVLHENCGADQVLKSGGRVEGVRLDNGEVLAADEVVIAAGAHSKSLAKKVGLSLPLQAAKGYHCDRDLAVGGTPSLGITFMLGERSVYCTPMGGFVRLAGTLEFSGLNHDIREPRLNQLTRSAKQYVSGLEDVKHRSEWCGLRPCLPDGYPAIGPVGGVRGLYLATGHAMLGLTLGPITGQLMAEMILDGVPSINIDVFSADRFA